MFKKSAKKFEYSIFKGIFLYLEKKILCKDFFTVRFHTIKTY